ncbi:MAG: hypothetical protein B7X07_05865 [Actinobacteria bacterium 21-64-8]|nr:MAG: hypothetical protein B7X07_05865 [Actinobacteria bacterium 21-64-8]
MTPRHGSESVMDVANLGAARACCLSNDVLTAYRAHLKQLDFCPLYVKQRLAAAHRLLDMIEYLDWHSDQVAPHLAGLNTRAKGFVTFLLLFGHLRPGYPYLFSRKITPLVREASLSPMSGAVAAVTTAAQELGFGKRHIEAFVPMVLLRVLIQSGKQLHELRVDDLADFRTAVRAHEVTVGRSLHHWTVSVHAVENVLYHLGVLPAPARHRSVRSSSWWDRLPRVRQTPLRTTMARYAELAAANHRESTVLGYCASFQTFATYLVEHAPEVQGVAQLNRREHIEPWLVWNRSRKRVLPDGTERAIGPEHRKNLVLDIKVFLDTIAEWDWPEAPARRLLFNSDLPKLDRALPRYIPRQQEERLLAAIACLDDPFQRCALGILRGTGMRIGELVDLELDCVHEVAGQGKWVKVPLGKLGTERMVPIDEATVALFDEVVRVRGTQRPLPHPDTGRPTAFLFVLRGKRISRDCIRDALSRAVQLADLHDPDGQPLRITPHQLRHTYATTLVNAGISVQALMRLLGHVTMEMSLRYGHLFDSTVRQQYDEALAKVKHQYSTAMLDLPVGKAGAPDEEWMGAHKLKTRLAHGYCQLDHRQTPCPLANVCERCPAFVPLPGARQTIERQLADVRLLIRDANARGWDGEIQRHRDVAERLERFLAEMPSAALSRKTKAAR